MTSLQEISVASHRLAARAFNPGDEGVPIILLHGITGTVHFWSDDLVALFVPYGPTYALSLPGHYPATFPPGFTPEALTAESLAAPLAAAIRHLVGARPAMLVGHSTGGFAVLAIAAHAPGLARGVISISGFTHGRWHGALGLAQRVARLPRVGRVLFKAVYGLNRATPWGQAASWFVYTPRPRIAAPTLALTGDRDPIVPPAQARTIAARVPDATLAILAGVGHMPFLEAPAVFREAVTSWLTTQLYNA